MFALSKNVHTQAMADDEIREALAGVVKHRRGHLGLSQRELAARAEVSDVFVSRIERGTVSPSLASLVKLSAGLDLDLRGLVHAITPRGKLRAEYTIVGGTLAEMSKGLAAQVLADLGSKAAAARALGVSVGKLNRVLAA